MIYVKIMRMSFVPYVALISGFPHMQNLIVGTMVLLDKQPNQFLTPMMYFFNITGIL